VQPRAHRWLPSSTRGRRGPGRPGPHLSRDFHVESGYEQGLKLIRLENRPTAIFAGSDLQALGLYRAAREVGLRIHEDLSVVGYDDLPVAEWIGPALTTIRQPLIEMAD